MSLPFELPIELRPFFTDEHFSDYPFVTIPQSFHDDRGDILNIADGHLGDVAHIFSHSSAIRANHYHETDWHLTYLVNGSMHYTYCPLEDLDDTKLILVNAGQMIFSPPKIVHRMDFLKKSDMIAISRNSRKSEAYDLDTKRVEIEHKVH